METVNWIQAISSSAIAILTIALIYITYMYAKTTKKMADVMHQEYKLRTKPIIEFRDVSGSFSRWDGGQVKFRLTNEGFIYVKLTSITLEWWLKKNADNHYVKNYSEDLSMISIGGERRFVFHFNQKDFQKCQENLNPEEIRDGPVNHTKYEIIVKYIDSSGEMFEKRHAYDPNPASQA